MVETLMITIGIIFLFFGVVIFKYPKGYLEFFGARILIFLNPENRLIALKGIALITMIIGVFITVSGIIK